MEKGHFVNYSHGENSVVGIICFPNFVAYRISIPKLSLNKFLMQFGQLKQSSQKNFDKFLLFFFFFSLLFCFPLFIFLMNCFLEVYFWLMQLAYGFLLIKRPITGVYLGRLFVLYILHSWVSHRQINQLI